MNDELLPAPEQPRPFHMYEKVALCAVGLTLFALNPLRDLWFYEVISTHEGFNSTQDAYIIRFAGQVLATFVTFPLAIGLILYGVLRAKRFSWRPRFDGFTPVWGILASLLALLMLAIEWEIFRYCLPRPWHWRTTLLTGSYIIFIYAWWTCSISHGPGVRLVHKDFGPWRPRLPGAQAKPDADQPNL